MSDHDPKRCQRCLIARVEELESQVQAVREVCRDPARQMRTTDP
jgi:hypothetical protein